MEYLIVYEDYSVRHYQGELTETLANDVNSGLIDIIKYSSGNYLVWTPSRGFNTWEIIPKC